MAFELGIVIDSSLTMVRERQEARWQMVVHLKHIQAGAVPGMERKEAIPELHGRKA